MDIKDIYWLAGLFEGEGYFAFYSCPRLQLIMTDEDVVVKARNLMSKDAKVRVYHPKTNRKTSYIFKLHGSPAVQWMLTLYSLLGRRRKEAIRSVIIDWKNMKGHYDGTFNLEHSRTIKMFAKYKGMTYKEAKQFLEDLEKKYA